MVKNHENKGSFKKGGDRSEHEKELIKLRKENKQLVYGE